MNQKIGRVVALTLGTSAQNVDGQLEGFMIQNLSDSATAYFKEKEDDSADCTSANGFAVPPGETLPGVFCAHKLSLVASAANTDVRLIFLDIG